ncbi:uncharacterized protein LACBIDRAFT_308555 [Laccaria bicolor S238N-H82]|uniref:Predicted protein n=1 Tax=Laccaria bicolor (strain S238N-H82 / ATCC MYA-4686) TaxID=486041 RepID=B0CWM1_LACBS|nr:uncharacterized protein LACBIDRAFT_308546 [Laccaria bicolor S238N-H82]XP_001875594.1 uncharacterized protein LACBIDRAFT_308555 [Laccaria bicolor S238N-H82]EDR13091.1 predicted protein [Laccaria bicolor S238N-H82]EDR13096.1 predicted protein [Laccaria bicolor S238N-H82]|eukprot:XP_001875589.1 predicted protein [Laccaria bicolor S238N-H82]
MVFMWMLSTPSHASLRLPQTILILMDKLQRNLSSILRGHGSGLAALVSAIPQRPLYVF